MSAARPSPRFATWQKDVVRAIDDYKRSLINWCWNPAETISPPSALFPIEILHEIASLCRRLELPLPAMQLAMDDVAFAYKRCAVLQQEYGILCYWNPEKKKVVFCEQWGPLAPIWSSGQRHRLLQTSAHADPLCAPFLRRAVRPLH